MILILMEFLLIYFFYFICIFYYSSYILCPKKPLPNQRFQRFSAVLSSRDFIVGTLGMLYLSWSWCITLLKYYWIWFCSIKNFIKWGIFVYEGCYSLVIFVWFWYQGCVVILWLVGKWSFNFNFLKEMYRLNIISSLSAWWNSPLKSFLPYPNCWGLLMDQDLVVQRGQ